MKILFAGTPDFAAMHLKALLDSEHEVVAVYTQPDRPKGRGRKLSFSPVKALVSDSDIPIKQPKTLRDESAQQELKAFNADVMIVVAYGLILPQAVLSAPKYGCLNVHASLLPRWRGAAPIQHAILAGDQTTGVTIMQMDEGLDTGDMLLKTHCAIESNDTGSSLHDKLAAQGPGALLKALELLAQDQLTPEKQADELSTYASKLSKAQAQIDWTQTAEEIDRKIRAFNSWPVAFLAYQGEIIRVWEAKLSTKQAESLPGQVVAIEKEAVYVATGQGVLALTQLQFPGKKALSVGDLINGKQLSFEVGSRFDV